MKTIMIPNIEYKQFEGIRNAIFKKSPWGVVNDTYCNGNGYLQFWDVEYIPEPLRKFIKSPPQPDVEINKEIERYLPDDPKKPMKLNKITGIKE